MPARMRGMGQTSVSTDSRISHTERSAVGLHVKECFLRQVPGLGRRLPINEKAIVQKFRDVPDVPHVPVTYLDYEHSDSESLHRAMVTPAK